MLTIEGPLLIEEEPGFVSSASGLVGVGDWLYVIADDLLELLCFNRDRLDRPGRLHPLFDVRPLPTDPALRKQRKPDLESLTLVPWGAQTQALLTLGSGSSPRRQQGVLQPLFPCGEVNGPPQIFELGPLYQELPFADLNIEGCALVGESLFLAQRGNNRSGKQALVELDWGAVLQSLKTGSSWTSALCRSCREVHLGTIEGVPLGITDLCPLASGRLAFSAAAENTENPYEDGPVVGSVVGWLDPSSLHTSFQQVSESLKVEGIGLHPQGGFQLVTDADDPKKPSLWLRWDKPPSA